MILIDLSKAFDSLSHSVPLNKLWSLGTSASALSWFESYLSDRQQTTRVGPSVSTALTVTHGVPQGSIPVLFNLYLNDLPEVIEETEIDSYVDDTKLYLSISLKDIQVGLSYISEDLKRVAEWCCSNFLPHQPKENKAYTFWCTSEPPSLTGHLGGIYGTTVEASSFVQRCRNTFGLRFNV